MASITSIKRIFSFTSLIRQYFLFKFFITRRYRMRVFCQKYIYTVGITFFVSVLIYHLFVRPYALTRFLFGMKPKDKPKPVMEVERGDDVRPVVVLSA